MSFYVLFNNGKAIIVFGPCIGSFLFPKVQMFELEVIPKVPSSQSFIFSNLGKRFVKFNIKYQHEVTLLENEIYKERRKHYGRS
ncbi:hypothetical protein QA612_19995 [Evansella sp. AB-P1]|uniref:hypothetical protein n=1 Tax=Evansella sp. AB-P1 TaxID=3037653 RepID=UPI00241FEED9|nr:hypothetical protein [Evansella sp. AB-P1]MDG5789744.1 hypothetical protein [Evansella sp. AB-P1]